MEVQYNLKNPAVKRLMKEACELKNPTEEYFAQPLDENLFEWHFTVRGPPDTEYAGGVYHGRVILPPDYPMKPPSIILLTPNGRFEVNTKICLSISGHHPESWQPSWSIRTALLAIIGFMPTHGNGAIGSLDYTCDERKVLAKKSQAWSCTTCGTISKLLLERSEGSDQSDSMQEEARDAAQMISMKGENNNGPKSSNGAAQSDGLATDTSAENSTESEVRQRVTSTASSSVANEHQSANQVNNAVMDSSFDKVNLLIWVISLVIFGLVVRRLFFV